MRCRRARSLLSIYCNGELTGRPQVALREHLAECADCRKEAAVFTSVGEACKEMPARVVAADFDTRLLNRIAAERFAETRSRAYFPQHAPIIRWKLAVPVLATACVAVVAAVSVFYSPQEQSGQWTAVGSGGPDESYQTVQPLDNPNMTGSLSKDWSLHGQLAQSERVSRIVHSLTTRNGFSGFQSPGGLSQNVAANGLPFVSDRIRVQPVTRFYEVSGSTNAGEDKKVY
jgi:hypothetical protein